MGWEATLHHCGTSVCLSREKERLSLGQSSYKRISQTLARVESMRGQRGEGVVPFKVSDNDFRGS